MNEYLLHYLDKNDGKVRPFYFVDYKDLSVLLKDLTDLKFEETYGEVLDMEKVYIEECEELPGVPA